MSLGLMPQHDFLVSVFKQPLPSMKHTQIHEGSFSCIPLNLPSSLLNACRGAVPCPCFQLVLPSPTAASGVRRSWACNRSRQSCPCLHSTHGLTKDTARAVPPLAARQTHSTSTAHYSTATSAASTAKPKHTAQQPAPNRHPKHSPTVRARQSTALQLGVIAGCMAAPHRSTSE